MVYCGVVIWGLWVMHLRVGRLVTLWVALSAVLSSIPPVLDCVITTAFESPCDLSPSFAHFGDQLLNQLALFR